VKYQALINKIIYLSVEILDEDVMVEIFGDIYSEGGGTCKIETCSDAQVNICFNDGKVFKIWFQNYVIM